MREWLVVCIKLFISVLMGFGMALVGYCVQLLLWGIGFVIPLSNAAGAILEMVCYSLPVIGFLLGIYLSKEMWSWPHDTKN